MSNIGKLPVYKFLTGVQADEDWALAFSITDAATGNGIDLRGITFTAFISTRTGQLAKIQGLVCGPGFCNVYFMALADDKAFIAAGVYQLTILADDGSLKHDLLGYSTINVGAPQTILATPLLTDEPNMAVVTIINPIVIGIQNAVSGALALTGSSAAPLPSVTVRSGVELKADRDNVGRVYVGIGGDATTSSFWLDPGDIQTFALSDLSQVNMFAVSPGDRVGYVGQ